MMRYVIASTALIAYSGTAFATTEYNKQVSYVGVQSGYGYVHFTTALTGPCANDIVYIDLSTDSGKAQLALAMTAKSSGQTITRVDYSMSSGTCYVSLLQM